MCLQAVLKARSTTLGPYRSERRFFRYNGVQSGFEELRSIVGQDLRAMGMPGNFPNYSRQ